MTRIAIATIDTEDGRMTIYYNGTHEYMTAVDGDYVEPLNAVAAPLSLSMSEDMVGTMYAEPCWDLQWIEREPESCNQYEPISEEAADDK